MITLVKMVRFLNFKRLNRWEFSAEFNLNKLDYVALEMAELRLKNEYSKSISFSFSNGDEYSKSISFFFSNGDEFCHLAEFRPNIHFRLFSNYTTCPYYYQIDFKVLSHYVLPYNSSEGGYLLVYLIRLLNWV